MTIVDDDDLPDPIYLEGDLAGPAGGRPDARVFIDDKDPATGTMVSLETATSAARMEPRMRERRIAVRRAVGRKRLQVGGGRHRAGRGRGRRARRARLGPVRHSTTSPSRRGVQPRRPARRRRRRGRGCQRPAGRHQRVERQLEAIPWVEDARVTTNFPHGARIEIRERRPSVTYQGADGRTGCSTTHGRVLDVVVGGQPVGYPWSMRHRRAEPRAGAVAPARLPRAPPTLVPVLDDGLRALAASVSVAADGSDLRLTLTTG